MLGFMLHTHGAADLTHFVHERSASIIIREGKCSARRAMSSPKNPILVSHIFVLVSYPIQVVNTPPPI
jgi:hypothetical protein